MFLMTLHCSEHGINLGHYLPYCVFLKIAFRIPEASPSSDTHVFIQPEP
jgi:hypothetical protein